MRRDGKELNQYPEFLVPVLMSYGGEDATEDLGNRPYKCPFHGDSTPSANLNTAAGWFHCHTHPDCPQGNAVQLIMHKENLDYASALERAETIARNQGISVRPASGSRGRLARVPGDRSGSRTVRRSWGSGRPSGNR